MLFVKKFSVTRVVNPNPIPRGAGFVYHFLCSHISTEFICLEMEAQVNKKVTNTLKYYLTASMVQQTLNPGHLQAEVRRYGSWQGNAVHTYEKNERLFEALSCFQCKQHHAGYQHCLFSTYLRYHKHYTSGLIK